MILFMKKCPKCRTSNENSNEFCRKCGQDLNTAKSHSLRNFMIIIIVIISIIVIGLVLYFVLVNYAGLDLSTIFSKGVQTVEYNEDQG